MTPVYHKRADVRMRDFSQVYNSGMGIIMNQQDNRTELQKRVAAELTDKAKKRKARDDELPDGVDDSAYIQGTKQTTSLAWVWILIVIAIVVAAIWYVISIVSAGNQF